MSAGLGFGKVELGLADKHFHAVIQISLQYLRKIHHARAVVIDHQHSAGESRFQLGVGKELIQYHACHHAAFDVDNDADTGFHARFVTDTGNTLHALVAHQIGDAFDQSGFVDSVGYFGNEDLLFVVIFDDLGAGAHLDRAAAGLIELADRRNTADDRSGREVRAGQMAHEFFDRSFGVIQQSDGGVDDFGKVVRGDACSHTHPDTGGTVDQKLRETRGQYSRLHIGFVEGGHHVDSIFFQIHEHFFGEAFQTALGVTVGSSGVAVDTTEVTVTIDHAHTQREGLSQTHHGIVNRTVAVGVIITDDFPDDLCTLGVAVRFGQAEFFHSVKDTAVHGFEPVADIRDGAADVDTQRILQIGSMHDVLNVDWKIVMFYFTHSFTIKRLKVNFSPINIHERNIHPQAVFLK